MVRGAALNDAGHVELLKLCLDAQGDAVGVLARGADGHGVGLVAVRRGHLRDLEDVRAAERIGGLGLVLLALLLGHGVDVGGLGVGIGRQQLGDGLAPDVLNAEQLDGARAVGCDMVVQIVKVTHIFPFPGHGLPLVFHCRYYNTPFGKWKVSIRSAGRRQIAQTLPHGAENFLAAICRFPFASGKNVGIMILYENMDICACAQDAEFFKKRGSYDMIPHGKEIKVFTGSSNPNWRT